MANDDIEKKLQLVGALRQGVAVVQMVFFKELRALIGQNHHDKEPSEQLKLTGAITNELFGTPNQEPHFVQFREEHKTVIEQELLGLAAHLPHLRRYLTDALRIQTLCDSHEGDGDNTGVLDAADRRGILLKERDIPLPSVFMTLVRGLGEQYQLIIPPVQISTEDDSTLVH